MNTQKKLKQIKQEMENLEKLITLEFYYKMGKVFIILMIVFIVLGFIIGATPILETVATLTKTLIYFKQTQNIPNWVKKFLYYLIKYYDVLITVFFIKMAYLKYKTYNIRASLIKIKTPVHILYKTTLSYLIGSYVFIIAGLYTKNFLIPITLGMLATFIWTHSAFNDFLNYSEKCANKIPKSQCGELLLDDLEKFVKSTKQTERTLMKKATNLIVLTEKQKELIKQGIESIRQGKNVIITGPTGSGKSFLAKEIKNKLEKDYHIEEKDCFIDAKCLENLNIQKNKKNVIIIDDLESQMHNKNVFENIKNLIKQYHEKEKVLFIFIMQNPSHLENAISNYTILNTAGGSQEKLISA